MKVLIACEYSGKVRDAFLAKGHDAVSCDYLESESPDGPHYVGDVRDLLELEWDLIIAHPPCTYLANSGVRWLYNNDGSRNEERWNNLKEATEFFNLFLKHPCNKKCVENPIPHRYANSLLLHKYTQTIQPYEYGHTATKRTCLWLSGLEPLKPTQIIPKEQRTHEIWLASPGPDRWKERSRTFQGIAQAMALQWG